MRECRAVSRNGKDIRFPRSANCCPNTPECVDLEIVSEFIDVESAKTPGRKEFGEMLRFLETDPNCRIVLVEKTDVFTGIEKTASHSRN